MKIECPFCGSSDISSDEQEKRLALPLHKPVPYKITVHRCNNCEEVGDFTGENDRIIAKVKEAVTKDSVLQLLHELSERGIKMTIIERSLGLPPKTINRWKTGESSAAAIALLRIVRTLPWVLEVAAEKYRPEIIREKIFEAAARVLKGEADKHYTGCKIETLQTDKSHVIQVELHVKEPMPETSYIKHGATAYAYR
ncbi:hypothetical protein KP005_19295 [Geomonas nitrogeniifigens]|uniref:Uncharacterized protein n=1 Tax=Geomonas diazotrophica TaxID=2843197 RepID=A0ABX8JI77_9BACT|nr:hypothetical protein [Geomonas nitrogeniifigens]QWV97453.1 hypothetical protein KP005_19295 [Geomonas nitrogeniifigens]